MADMHIVLLLSWLSAVFVAFALVGRRRGDDRTDVRLLLATGAGFGGLALIVLSLQGES